MSARHQNRVANWSRETASLYPNAILLGALDKDSEESISYAIRNKMLNWLVLEWTTPGADIEAIENIVVNSESLLRMLNFATRVPGADVDRIARALMGWQGEKDSDFDSDPDECLAHLFEFHSFSRERIESLTTGVML